MSKGVSRKGNVLSEIVGGEKKTEGRGVDRAIKVDVEVSRDDKIRRGE